MANDVDFPFTVFNLSKIMILILNKILTSKIVVYGYGKITHKDGA